MKIARATRGRVDTAHFDRRETATWERGAGETWACGTGASAAGVAGVITGRTEREITIHLKGGDLLIEWRDNNRVYMTGGAEEVFHGTVKIA